MFHDLGPCIRCGGGQPGGLRSFVEDERGVSVAVCDQCFADVPKAGSLKLDGPLVSVLIPAHNSRDHVGGAVRSALRQTYRNLEVIVVDDGSTDDTAAAAKEDVDGRVRVLRSETNRGVSAARNAAFEEARGGFVAFLDADDEMLPDRIARQMAFLCDNPGVHAVSSRVMYVDRRGRALLVSDPQPCATAMQLGRFVAAGGVVNLWLTSSMMREFALRAIGGFDVECRSAGDVEMWNRFVDRGFVAVEQPDVLTLRRIHAGAMMSANARRVWEMSAWVQHNIGERRAGRPEVSFDEYQDGRSMVVRMNHRRLIFGREHYRMAGVAMLGGRSVPAAWHMAASCLATPAYTVGRVAAQLRGRILARSVGDDRQGHDRAG